MDFLGPIELRKPDFLIGVFEEYKPLSVGPTEGTPTPKRHERGRDLASMRHVWMGSKVCDSRRHMMDVFDLKKRSYIGTTSMAAGQSLRRLSPGRDATCGVGTDARVGGRRDELGDGQPGVGRTREDCI